VLDVIAGALANLPAVELEKMPRMADFARVGVAVARTIGLPDAAFLDAYARNVNEGDAAALEDSPIAGVIEKLLSEQIGRRWEGPAGVLLAKLEQLAGEGVVRRKDWPGSPSALSRRLSAEAPVLRRQGIEAVPATRKGSGRGWDLRVTASGDGNDGTQRMPSPSKVLQLHRNDGNDGNDGTFPYQEEEVEVSP
jgi:hypothetical protein